MRRSYHSPYRRPDDYQVEIVKRLAAAIWNQELEAAQVILTEMVWLGIYADEIMAARSKR